MREQKRSLLVYYRVYIKVGKIDLILCDYQEYTDGLDNPDYAFSTDLLHGLQCCFDTREDAFEAVKALNLYTGDVRIEAKEI